jgi:hypothetical protein
MAPTTIDEIIERLREKDREPNDPVLGAILYLYYRTSNGESMGARLLRELSEHATAEAGSEADKVGLNLKGAQRKALKEAIDLQNRLDAQAASNRAVRRSVQRAQPVPSHCDPILPQVVAPVMESITSLRDTITSQHTESIDLKRAAVEQQRYSNISAAKATRYEAALGVLNSPGASAEIRAKAEQVLTAALDEAVEMPPPLPNPPPPMAHAFAL